ncbi:Possible protochlorophyllide reductase [Hoyosella subflava DQS3-9A1]|uniref:Possible protochlorophyllide reductase n=2 Tax=Hoyosella TaxID=697025 RepID=F6EM39_HOYSD|nr:Possible protochlorophyllide reductase [Hoyosella subflava DQS3-9A1]
MSIGMYGWTPGEMNNQSGRSFVVTGANSGLGAVTARVLAEAGASVILACRNTDRGEAVADRIRKSQPEAQCEVRSLDLADLSSVYAFTNECPQIDVLINNAGVMAVPKTRTKDGFEMQLGTNHLGHFALTGLLLDRITDRVVTVSSGMHLIGRVDLKDLNWERRKYRRWPAYAQSKLANLLFTYELQRRFDAAGSGMRAVAAHPGYASTGLQSHTGTIQDRLMRVTNKLLAQSAEGGALPSLYAATAPSLPGGSYVGPAGRFEQRGSPVLVRSNKRSRDRTLAKGLWEESEALTGVAYRIPADTGSTQN